MHFFTSYCCILAWMLCSLSALSQNAREVQQAKFILQIAKTNETLSIDGRLDENAWQLAKPQSGFSMKWPRDGGPAPEDTEVRCTYDDKFLYIGIICRDSSPNHVINSLKRDVGYWDSDAVSVILDPTNAANNGYFFGTNPSGVQYEGLLGGDDIDFNWDNTWFTATHNYADRWTAEFAIPFRILRFKEGQTRWGINLIRNDLGNGMYSTWATVPFQFDGVDLGWTGVLEWDASPKRTKGNYNISPYTNSSFSKNYENKEDWEIKPNAGVDAKIGIGSGLNLDVTVNPDFSQVEIDEQVINLTRFDVQLPEKRTFFLENADLFGNFGIPPIRPFFSRQIGLDEDGLPVPILAGLRLTGNVGADTRIGLLTMHTRETEAAPQRNFSALAVRHRVFGRSTVGGYFLDREEFEDGEHQKNRFSRNAGIELNYVSTDGKWSVWANHHHSFRPGINTQNFWNNSGFNYSVRRFNWTCDFLRMGQNYYADLGFEQRIDNYDVVRDSTLRIGYNFIFNDLSLQFFPKNKETSRLNYIELGGEIFNVLNPDGSWNESSNNISIEANFKNTSSFSFSIQPSFANSPVSFSFIDRPIGECPALTAGEYSWVGAEIGWNSDYRKTFIYNVSAGGGSFYNGRNSRIGVGFTWRIQPIANISFNATYNSLNFPAPYCDASFFNITPRFEVFFAKNIWWTTFVQYNTQADNFNINSRLQWRYRPMSDIFLVYTDNYGVEVPGVKNRALVLKAGYWF